MADRGRLPDALFYRDDASADPLRGLLFLLTATGDPEALARRLGPVLGLRGVLPLPGKLAPLWTADADAWTAHALAGGGTQGEALSRGWAIRARGWVDDGVAAMRAATPTAAVIAMTFLYDHAEADAAGFVYRQLSAQEAERARRGLNVGLMGL